MEFNLEDMDMSGFRQGATYEEIQECKSENSKSPVTPKDKEDAIIDAFRHFQMI